eukprot:5465132-Amphidinium_carterae.1
MRPNASQASSGRMPDRISFLCREKNAWPHWTSSSSGSDKDTTAQLWPPSSNGNSWKLEVSASQNSATLAWCLFLGDGPLLAARASTRSAHSNLHCHSTCSYCEFAAGIGVVSD